MDKRRFLKVKIKSLAEEARIIRLEEHRAKGDLREQLYLHRVINVRQEARATQWAYAIIRGKSRAQIEPKHETGYCSFRPQKRAAEMLAKYGDPAKKDEAKDIVARWAKGESNE